MPSVRHKNGKWHVRYVDEAGIRRERATPAATKTEAKRLAGEIEARVWRIRSGLEIAPASCGLDLQALLTWWLTTYVAKMPSGSRTHSRVRRHLLSTDIARLPLHLVTAGKLELLLQSKSSELSPTTLNHLRADISAAFAAAIRAELYTGKNPALAVQRRRPLERKPDYLRASEVRPLLEALAQRWRPLFATAIYTGLRKGELLGLRKTDVDLPARQIIVRRSHARDSTKSGRDGVVPIAAELVPLLQAQIASAVGQLVFGDAVGKPMRSDVKLQDVLRRALGRAGIVTGYRHVCRVGGCGFGLDVPDCDGRRCPHHGHRLWPKAQVRRIRFHDLRHTTASLLMMAGANPGAVQRILRHADQRTTMNVYAHLAPDYLLAEIDRLRFFGGC